MSESAFGAVAVRARTAATELALATRATKDTALLAMADALESEADEVLSPHAAVVRAAEGRGRPARLADRPRRDTSRINGMAHGRRDVAALPDPVGEVV